MENGIDIFAYLLTFAWNEIINRPFTLFGYHLTFFQSFAYTTVGGLCLWIMWEVFFDGR